MIKQSQATAVWKGDLKGGKGVVDSQHGALKEVEYNFATRFGDQRGANPEELIAAAEAACFSMALSAELGKANITADKIATTATAKFDEVEGIPTVTEVHLTTEVLADGADREEIMRAAEAAKAGCPISRLLKAKITLDLSTP